MAVRPIYPYLFLVLDASDDANATAAALRVLSEDVYIFHDKCTFDDFIAELKVDRNTVVLIVSGSLGIQLKSELLWENRYAKIESIYIYCHNVSVHRRWSSAIDKVSTDRMQQNGIHSSSSLDNTCTTMMDD